MGASQWVTFIDHHAEPRVAFAKAREKVFAAGDYYRASRHGPTPTTIDAAVQQANEDGTHSILDLDRLDSDPSPGHPFGVARALTSSELKQLFGSDRPTRAQVDQRRHDLECERGTGRYFVVYEDGEAHEYCFFGVTGD